MIIWKDTTEKDEKIYNDMFIVDSGGKYEYVEVYKGNIRDRKELTFSEKENLIKNNNLIKRGEVFENCFTYRSKKSWELIDKLIKNYNLKMKKNKRMERF